MKHIGLFEGMGGFSLAAKWMGWETIAWCEWNPFCQTILKYYFPNAKQHSDITKTDFTIYRGQCDILTGGFPCQPYSVAGKRKGKDDERHLWPEMLRAIREIQPSWVVGENVSGLINWNGGMVFDEVQTDLEAAGYEVIPFVLPACGVNAPHRRDRVWFVAYSESNGKYRKYGSNTSTKRENREWDAEFNSSSTTASHPNSASTEHTVQTGRNVHASSLQQITTHPNSNGQQRGNCEHEIKPSEGGQYALNDVEQVVVYADSKGLEGFKDIGETERKGKGKQQFTARPVCPTWQNFPTQSPICGGDDGLPTELDGITFPKWRNESIKAYGNAIVPQVVLQIYKAINQLTKTGEQVKL